MKTCFYYFLVLLASLSLLGCSNPTNIDTKIVKVPVPVCTPIPLPEAPKLEIYNITKDTATKDVVKAYIITFEQLVSHNAILTELLLNHNKSCSVTNDSLK